ncbi:AraC family transcriptional regulator [Bradyrhizobium canariense]
MSKERICDVAYGCGFVSSRHFSRLFKAHFSIPQAIYQVGCTNEHV